MYSLPFAVQPFTVAFRSLDPTLLDVAKTFGATRLQIFRHVAVPMSWHGILAGMVLSFAHTLGEFGSSSWWAVAFPVSPGPCRFRSTTRCKV